MLLVEFQKRPALLNINALEKTANSNVINLLNYAGQLKVKLPTENYHHGDYTRQELVKFCVDKYKVKDNSNWGWARISAKLTTVPKEKILELLPIIFWKQQLSVQWQSKGWI